MTRPHGVSGANGALTNGAGDYSARLAALAETLSRIAPGDTALRHGEPMGRRTTLRVGGRADLYFEPPTEAAAQGALQSCAEFSIPWMALGRGSNLLVRDGGIRGLVVALRHPNFSTIGQAGETLLAGAGVRLKALSIEARRLGLAGLEFLEGIPGSVGGALRMNAGAQGIGAFDTVESVRFLDASGALRVEPAAALGARYRSCPSLRDGLALSAVFRGRPEPEDAIRDRMETYNRRRWESQPSQPSAGCVFKNPAPGLPAGRLLDELGLKGARIGGAMISEIHANFIVNMGGATAADVLDLIAMARQRARDERGVELETEVEIIGEEARE